MNQSNRIEDAETFEIALGKTKDIVIDDVLVNSEKGCLDEDEFVGRQILEMGDGESSLENERKHFCCPSIDTSLLAYKVFYLFFLAAVGSLIPFLAVFYKQLWLSAKQTGILLGIGPLIKIIAIPMWGIIVDFYKQSKCIFIMSLVAWLVSHYSISLVSPVVRQSSCNDNSSITLLESAVDAVTKHKSNEQRFLIQTASDQLKKGTSTGKDYLTNRDAALEMLAMIDKHNGTNITDIANALAQEQLERVFDFLNMQGHYPWPMDTFVDFKDTGEADEWENDHNNYLFTVLFVITAMGTLLCSPTLTLADIATLQRLGENQQNYGKQRLWGSFGFGAGAFLVGACIGTMQELKGCNNPLNVDYKPCFYLFAALMAIAIPVGFFIQFDDKPQQDTGIFDGLTVICQYEYMYFIFTILFCGCATGIIQTFLFWHLEEIGGSQFLFSCIAVLQCCSDIMMYFCSGTLITYFGHQKVLYAGLVCFTMRFLGYSFITSSWLILPLEIFHGVTSAAVWSAGVVFVGLTPGAPSTLQGILGGVYSGVGCGGGGMVGGFLINAVGCRYTFLILAIVSFAHLVFFLIFDNCLSKSVNSDT